MSIRFNMVGNLIVAKDSDKHKAFEDKMTDKGGVFRTLRLNMKCGNDFFSPQIKGFLNSAKRNSDGTLNVNDSDVYSLEQDLEGKYNSIKFKYKDKDKHMNDLAEFKKMVFVNDNERYEFCNEFDFSEFVHSELKSGKFDNAKFRVVGEIEYTSWFNEKTNQEQTFTNYSVNRIYVVPDDTEEEATANIEMYVTEDCINEDRLEENLLIVNGYIPQYDSKKKADIGFYKSIEYPLNAEGELAEKKTKVIKRLLVDNFDENQLCKIGFKVDLINRREELEFNEDMLSDDEKEMVELGLMDIEDLKLQYGGGMGNRIEKMSVNGIGRGYSKGAIPCELTIEQLMKKADEEKPKQEVNVDLNGNSDDDDLNIFADDDLPF